MFKKSLFTGALDEGGQDVVMIGQNQLQKFMQTIEAVAENLEKVDPVSVVQEEMEAARDSRDMDKTEEEEETKEAGDHFSEAIDKGAQAGMNQDATDLPLNQLLLKGAKFLTNLSNTLAQSNQPPFEIMEKQLKSAIEHDGATGKTYVKIPMPAPEVVQNIFTLLGEVLANIVSKR
jgi:nitrate reductase NapAB chaperone NapD